MGGSSRSLNNRISDLLLPFRWDLTGFALGRAFSTVLLAFATSRVWVSGEALGLQVAFYLCSSCVALGLVLVSAAAVAENLRPGGRFDWVFAAFGVGGILCVGLGTELGLAVLALVGCALAGVCAGFLETVWGKRFVTLPMRGIQPYTLLMNALAAIIGVVLGVFSNTFAFYVVAGLFPVCSVVLYRREPAGEMAAAQDGRATGSADPGVLERRLRALVNILLCYLVFSAIYNMVIVLTYDYLPSGTASQLRVVTNMLTALALLVLVLFLRPVSSTLMFRLVLPVTAVGFVLFLTVPQSLGWLAMTVSGVGRKLFDILTWVLVAQAVQAYSLSCDRYFGFMIAGKNMGYLLGLLLATVTLGYDSGVVQIVTFVPVLLLVLIVLFFWLFPERTLDQLFGVVDNVSPAAEAGSDNLEAKSAAVAGVYGLTPREAEVLVLLARGRTQAVIAEKLAISAGTAHTHIIHVYQKLGIGKQQELIELVERTVVGDDGAR